MIKKLSLEISNYIIKNSEKEYSKEEKEEIIYGTTSFFMNLYKYIIIFLIVYFLNIEREFFIFFISFNFVRKFAGGFHLDSGLSCLITSVLIIFLSIYPAFFLEFKINFIFLISLISILKYSPADTKKRPIVSPAYRKKLKFISVFFAFILFIISFFVSTKTSNIITLSVFIASLLILPSTYKLFNQPYNNYLKYKKK